MTSAPHGRSAMAATIAESPSPQSGGHVPDRTATRPAEPFADVKARVADAVEVARAEIIDLSHRIHAHPEPAFEERQASSWIAEALRAHGFSVEHPAGSLDTA